MKSFQNMVISLANHTLDVDNQRRAGKPRPDSLEWLWGSFEPICKSITNFRYFFEHLIENVFYISMRLDLLSTLKRWAYSSKLHRFENALESGQ